ncbi:hypothetical protein AV656_08645 [Bhargavaea cecembensis]|uniref:Uncharacterized protein n=1 Tax=Bhargavaea cecembensis TaxID=394098 RepID=A0A163FMV1_9BACL|nr:hypothetical protein [Bhargavaea cecembensis]KZE38956.1 hypothetical protein AV656_08645 [Bhargavaea cecembensis]
MEPVVFRELSHDQWEHTASGLIAYSPKGIDIRTADRPIHEHFRTLQANRIIITNLTALNGTNVAIGGRYEVDLVEDGRIFLKPHRSL